MKTTVAYVLIAVMPFGFAVALAALLCQMLLARRRAQAQAAARVRKA
jgi:hypothetical protein